MCHSWCYDPWFWWTPLWSVAPAATFPSVHHQWNGLSGNWLWVGLQLRWLPGPSVTTTFFGRWGWSLCWRSVADFGHGSVEAKARNLQTPNCLGHSYWSLVCRLWRRLWPWLRSWRCNNWRACWILLFCQGWGNSLLCHLLLSWDRSCRWRRGCSNLRYQCWGSTSCNWSKSLSFRWHWWRLGPSKQWSQLANQTQPVEPNC